MTLNNKLQILIKEHDQLRKNEDILGLASTEIQNFNELQISVGKYVKLWTLVLSFNENYVKWSKDTVIYKLNAEEIETIITSMT